MIIYNNNIKIYTYIDTAWDSLLVNTGEPEKKYQTYTSNNTISFNKPILDPVSTYEFFYAAIFGNF